VVKRDGRAHGRTSTRQGLGRPGCLGRVGMKEEPRDAPQPSEHVRNFEWVEVSGRTRKLHGRPDGSHRGMRRCRPALTRRSTRALGVTGWSRSWVPAQPCPPCRFGANDEELAASNPGCRPCRGRPPGVAAVPDHGPGGLGARVAASTSMPATTTEGQGVTECGPPTARGPISWTAREVTRARRRRARAHGSHTRARGAVLQPHTARSPGRHVR
jgi:hypothetical protein